MSDTQNAQPFDGEDNKHHAARALAEAALRAEAAGDYDKADKLMDDAERTDPLAADAVLSEAPRSRRQEAPGSDEEVATMTRQVRPGSDAPSRSGIDDD